VLGVLVVAQVSEQRAQYEEGAAKAEVLGGFYVVEVLADRFGTLYPGPAKQRQQVEVARHMSREFPFVFLTVALTDGIDEGFSAFIVVAQYVVDQVHGCLAPLAGFQVGPKAEATPGSL